MNSSFKVKLSSSKSKTGTEFWEGTVSVPGLRPTKLVRKADGGTQFSTKSAASQAARNMAKLFDMEAVFDEPKSKTAPVKKAAKKSAKKATKKASKKPAKKTTKKKSTSCTTTPTGAICSPPWMAT